MKDVAPAGETASILNPEYLESLMRGSHTAAAFRRAGGTDLRVNPETGRIAGTYGAGKTNDLMAMIEETRDDLAAFLRFEAQHGDKADQELALSCVRRLIDAKVDGTLDITDPEAGLLGITGLAGSGKTFLAAEAARYAISRGLTNIIVSALSNRATSVVGGRLSAAGIGLPEVQALTCHKALRRLGLTDLGRHVAKAIAGIETLDATGIAESIAETFAEGMAAMTQETIEGLRAKLQAAEAFDQSTHFTRQAIAAFKQLGFAELDNRLTYWMRTPAPADMFILDEVSMIGRGMARDALASGAIVLALGDRMQLPPVELEYVDAKGGRWPDAAAMDGLTPVNSVALQRSRRTANASAIPEVASRALYLPNPYEILKDIPRGWDPDAEVCIVSQLSDIPGDVVAGDFVGLAYTNVERLRMAVVARKLAGFPHDRLVAGDVLAVSSGRGAFAIEHGLLKDELITIVRADTSGERASGGLHAFDLRTEDGRILRDVTLSISDPRAPNDRRAALEEIRGVDRGEFGDGLPVMLAKGLTIHKSQGSQWATVCVAFKQLADSHRTHEFDDSAFDDGTYQPKWRRLLYVAMTRAAKRLVLIA